MFKTADLIFVGIVLAVASATYVVKYGSEIEYNNIAKLEREIIVEKEAIDILKANWGLLTNPARIQTLSNAHKDELKLDVLDPQQIISIEQIPLKPIVEPDAKQAENTLENEPKDLITGSIKSEVPTSD